MANKDLPLTVGLVSGVLTVSIGVSTLCQTIKNGTVFEDFLGGEGAEITDEYAFARAITEHLTEVEEDGSTKVHHMLDVAARGAIGDGCDGVKLGEH